MKANNKIVIARYEHPDYPNITITKFLDTGLESIGITVEGGGTYVTRLVSVQACELSNANLVEMTVEICNNALKMHFEEENNKTKEREQG